MSTTDTPTATTTVNVPLIRMLAGASLGLLLAAAALIRLFVVIDPDPDQLTALTLAGSSAQIEAWTVVMLSAVVGLIVAGQVIGTVTVRSLIGFRHPVEPILGVAALVLSIAALVSAHPAMFGVPGLALAIIARGVIEHYRPAAVEIATDPS
ncbi:hypothetical protein V6N00_13610 [Tersicoccus sp. MR15.9]|uniref:hypothetical protein n=1 Tax=Tersicoccus mangrovi TaxID=3121635 RepID=UPI002FE5094D